MTGSDQDQPELREQLLQLVPPPPVGGDRAGAVRRRAIAARRRRTVGTVVVATVAVVGVVAGVAGLGPLHDEEADPAAPTAFSAAACPEGTVAPNAGQELPEHAVAVRLCGVDGITVPVPDDALVTGVDDLLAEIARQPVLGADAVCSLELGPAYILQVQLADGTLRRVRGELYGCGQLSLGGGVERQGSREVYGVFVRSLLRQREQLRAPGASRTPLCTDQPGAPGRLPALADLGAAERAVLCPAGNGPAIAVPARDLVVLVEAWQRAKGRIKPPPGCARETDRLVATTAWNDVVGVDIPCGHWPGRAAQTIIDRLLGVEKEEVDVPDPGFGSSDPGTSGGGPAVPRRNPPATQPTDPSTTPTEDPSGTPTDGTTGSPGPSDGPTTDPEPTGPSDTAGRAAVRPHE